MQPRLRGNANFYKEEWQSWFNALVLKTSVPLRAPGVRIPLPPPSLLKADTSSVSAFLMPSSLQPNAIRVVAWRELKIHPKDERILFKVVVVIKVKVQGS